jgi:hypothetical protein
MFVRCARLVPLLRYSILTDVRRGRALQIVAVFLVLGAIGTDLVGSRCHASLAAASRTVMAAASSPAADADPCGSTCVPDCYSCARSEEASFVLFELGAQVIGTAFAAPEPCATEGVRPLPYHPPLHRL